MDRAPARGRLRRQADAGCARRADGRGCAVGGAGNVRRDANGRRAGGDADGADVRAGVPRRLRRTLEARDAAFACARHEAAHPSRARRPPGRCPDREGRAQLVRRSRGRAGGNGEPGAGGAVGDDAARRDARAAARGLQPVQGTAPAQVRLQGALPDGRRVRRARPREGRRPAPARSRFGPDADEVRSGICRAALAVVEAVHGEGHPELPRQRHPARHRPSPCRLGRARRHRPLLPRIRAQEAGRRGPQSRHPAQPVRLRHRVGPSARGRRQPVQGDRPLPPATARAAARGGRSGEARRGPAPARGRQPGLRRGGCACCC